MNKAEFIKDIVATAAEMKATGQAVNITSLAEMIWNKYQLSLIGHESLVQQLENLGHAPETLLVSDKQAA